MAARSEKPAALDEGAMIVAVLADIDTLQAAGRTRDAERALRRLIAEAPHCVDAWNRLGVLLAGRGDALPAVACLTRALQVAPGEPSLHANLGEIMRRAGLVEEALAHCRRAVELGPAHPAANLNLGYALLDAGQAAAALAHFERVARAEPASAFAWTGLGRARLATSDAAGAAAALSRTIALAPSDALAHALLARAHLRLDDFDAALAAARQAHAIAPGFIDAVTALADVHMQGGRPADAEVVLREALARLPAHAALTYRLALVRLGQGDYREGFSLYETRVELEVDNRIELPILPMPPWRCEDLRGRRLLVLTEQGFGDHLQFARFVAPLAAAGVTVEVGASPEMRDLMLGLEGCSAVHTLKAQARAAPCDYWTLIGSLPHRAGVDRHGVTPAGPYVRADDARRARWRARLAPYGGLRVGLVWGGRPGHENDWRRSVPYAALAPLAAVPGIAWVSLQHGARAADAASGTQRPASAAAGPAFVARDAPIADFADLAALMAELDLIITIDSAPAHLAGALGRPVWTLLPRVADWRWQLAEETTPWYPTMRLFRQSAQGDWAGVIARVAAALPGFSR
jgi:tetratricopeptide (TPR) repeat protein